MARTKSGIITKKRHKRILKATKGYYGAKSIRFTNAKQALYKSLSYSYISRKRKKRDFKRLWIIRINAAARLNHTNYSCLKKKLKSFNSILNTKMLAEIAVNDSKTFSFLCNL